MSLDIKSIIHGQYEDYSAVLAQKSNWMDLDFLDRKLLTFTRPFSETFYNPLGLASFLFHFKNVEWFNFFPVLFVRDGLISILHFFYEHPTPNGITTTLILPQSAKNFVPAAWQGQCCFYSIKRHNPIDKPVVENIYISTMVNSELYTLEDLEKRLKLVAKLNLPVKGLFTRHQPLGEEKIINHDNHDFEFFKLVNDILGDKLELINYLTFEQRDLSRSSFLELNQFDSWYNDNIIVHRLLAQGAVPAVKEQYSVEKFNIDDSIRISKYHYYKLFSLDSESKKKGKECWEFINKLPSHIFENEKELDRKAQDFHQVFLCTPEFHSLTNYLVKKYSANESL